MTDLAATEQMIQIESVMGGGPVGEAAWQAIGGAINAILMNKNPIGTIIASFLDEPTFQTQTGTNWVLADGRSVTGSRFETLTGLSNVPDMRGTYVRGKNYARSTSTGDADGDKTVGTYTADKFASHGHGGHFDTFGNGLGAQIGGGDGVLHGGFGFSVNNTGGNETSPRSVTANFYVRIN